MSCHSDLMMVPPATDADVYFVGGKVASETPGSGPADPVQAELALNCEEMKAAYGASTASTAASFDDFHREVQQEGEAALNEVYNAQRLLNEAWETNPAAQRSLVIRVCVRWRWLRIYITIRL